MFNCTQCDKKFIDENGLRAHSLFEHDSYMQHCSTTTLAITRERAELFGNFINKYSDFLDNEKISTKKIWKKLTKKEKQFKRECVIYAIRWLSKNWSKYGLGSIRIPTSTWESIIEKDYGEYVRFEQSKELIKEIEDYFKKDQEALPLNLYIKTVKKDTMFRKELEFIGKEIFGYDTNDYNVNENNRTTVFKRLLMRQKYFTIWITHRKSENLNGNITYDNTVYEIRETYDLISLTEDGKIV